ncbi:MAG: ParB N-terminal domain-containing protein [Solirubrobacteraceae bacterium]
MSTTTAVSTLDQITAGGPGGVPSAQLRHVPLSRIIVPDGFNPRGEVEDDRELGQMAESVRRDGCLQPIRVRATEHGDYLLISGERGYRAAVKAARWSCRRSSLRSVLATKRSRQTCWSRRFWRMICAGASILPLLHDPLPAALDRWCQPVPARRS